MQQAGTRKDPHPWSSTHPGGGSLGLCPGFLHISNDLRDGRVPPFDTGTVCRDQGALPGSSDSPSNALSHTHLYPPGRSTGGDGGAAGRKSESGFVPSSATSSGFLQVSHSKGPPSCLTIKAGRGLLIIVAVARGLGRSWDHPTTQSLSP